ncbi:MAG: SDR family NAD(P)-dependent oxidoreductase, partial [Cupriavidus sp.]|nr:SDR family NAD(P)-dependent oxidoreductase [Cupriavidus sp.]
MTESGQARVAVVTGASRGAGRGIALALGAAGATVYVTGRTEQEGSAPLPGTIHATAREIDALGGRGIAVACDHGDDAQVAALFRRVREEAGRLDILVNNATSLHDQLILPGPFWLK